MFTLFCAQNWFVFDATFNSPNNQDWLSFKYQIIFAGCLFVQKISRNVEQQGNQLF